MKLKALDLFCGAGGASMGLHEAGFDVTGVDINPQPRYPFRFIQADALTFDLSGYDLIWASPPCQRYTIAANIHDSAERHPDLVAPIRWRLMMSRTPYVIENVVGSPLLNPVRLCGVMFDLRVFRHRLFEASWPIVTPPHPKHVGGCGSHRFEAGWRNGDGRSYPRGEYVTVAGHNFEMTSGAQAMGIDWMGTRRELAQAIPPAYSRYIGEQAIALLQGERVA